MSDPLEMTSQAREISLRDMESLTYALEYRRDKGAWWDDLEKRLLLRAVGAAPGRRVLDAGCGTGRITFALAKAGCLVEGVDFSAESIRVLRSNYPQLQSIISARVCDLTQSLPLPHDSLDGVVSCQVVQHIPSRVGRVCEWRSMATVTRHGSRLAVVVYNAGRGTQTEGWMVDSQLFYHRYTREDLCAELAEGGWTDIRISAWYHQSWRGWPSSFAMSLETILTRIPLLDWRARYLFVTARRG